MIHNSGYIDVNGSTLHYQISGKHDGHPLLMLHGGLGSISEFEPIHQWLSDSCQLISLDFRGHGKSRLGKARLSYQQYQSDVQALLRHLGIDQYSVLGFSDGGIVGYRLAVQEPKRVKCLITLGAQWKSDPQDPSMQLLASLTADFWRERFPNDVALYESANPEPNYPKLVDAVKEAWFDQSESGYPGQSVSQITCPTLIMRGDNDFIFPLEEAVQLKEKIAGSSFANLPLASHACHQEYPELVGAMVKQFITQRCKY